MGEHFPCTVCGYTAIPRHAHVQPQRMAYHRHIGDSPDHGVAVDTLATTLWTLAPAVVNQIAEHHRDIAIDGGVGDRHTELDSSHDRVGNNSSRQRRRLRHRAPRTR